MIFIELAEDHIALDCPPTYNELAKRIPGARYKGSWRLPLSWVACVQAREVFGELLQVGPALVEWATAKKQQKDWILWCKEAIPDRASAIMDSWHE